MCGGVGFRAVVCGGVMFGAVGCGAVVPPPPRKAQSNRVNFCVAFVNFSSLILTLASINT